MRAWVAAAALLAAFSMGSWTQAVDSGEAGLLPWLAQPEQHVGAEVVIPLAEVTGLVPGGYRARKAGRELVVQADARGVVAGQTYTLGGTFHPHRGVVVEEWRELHRYRPHKKLLGMLGVVLSLALAVAAVRPSGAGLEVRDA